MARVAFTFRQTNRRLFVAALVLLLFGTAGMRLLAATGSLLDERSLTISDSQAGATARYKFSFQSIATDPIQTVLLQLCANDPFAGAPCVAPTGLDVSAAVLTSQSGDTGFTISPQSSANQIVLTRPPAASNSGQNVYEFSGIINPSDKGSYYGRIQTFTGTDIGGDSIGFGGLAFTINSGVDINATVPPFLLFCVGVTVQGFNCNSVSGDYVNFGEFDSRQSSQGSTQMLAATNAVDGYTIRVNGRTLISGNNVIPALVSNDVSRPGVSQFGLNLRANSAPVGGQDVAGAGNGQPVGDYNQPNFFRFNAGDIVAASALPDEARKYTTTYIVNVSRDQAPGIYVSTMNYIALGNF